MREANRFPWSGLLALAAPGFVAIHLNFNPRRIP